MTSLQTIVGEKVYKKIREKFYDWLTKNLEFQTVLDAGAGEGYFSEWARKKGKTIEAIDIEPKKPFIKKMNIEKTTYKNNYFDLVFCSHTIEHTNYFKTAKELQRISKKYLIITAPTPHKKFWDEPSHKRPFTKETLKRLFKEMKPLKEFQINIPLIAHSCGVVFEKRKGEH